MPPSLAAIARVQASRALRCCGSVFAPPPRWLDGVEPQAGNDVQQSLQQGQRVRIATPVTIADGAQTPMVGEITFEIIRRLVDAVHTVTDPQLVQAMRFYAERMKMVVEPTGCLSLAAAIQASEQLQGQRVGIIVSGGNVDLGRFAQLISQS
ncbi:MAG: pyridoxal-phosphate dependent enzyme [Limnohabitans sp.]|nr:pyridoxal-phosphate dependent enzyme [Limnohabitans sp.]